MLKKSINSATIDPGSRDRGLSPHVLPKEACRHALGPYGASGHVPFSACLSPFVSLNIRLYDVAERLFSAPLPGVMRMFINSKIK